MGKVTVTDHPLIQHKLTLLRDVNTSSKDFRQLLTEITMLMGHELTRDLPIQDKVIQTPMGTATGKEMAGKKPVIVPVLRAGLGMVDGLLNLVPGARVGHIGLYRDPETLQPVEYYCKLPKDVSEREVIIVDPMLATGGSLAAAIDFVKERGASHIRALCLLAAPEGMEALQKAHPDVDIYVSCIDEKLDDNAYIVPGLGDAGDRIFGTK
ncbi:uracil phosphoribosyltransferase [Aedoeadaptatus coxii]|uniref:Uracil phosphoribosyltransferase n=1 Tax=Aedoeadaptatus coxii TaxID=755172 RepID=A0A134AHV1_9FIRM|nr:uracil phosphoribosyltransferase [Peptoniphilus coxii]KXB67291.1 uracil phosphoribosyltransferase [Peptoniphilus coxii]CAC9934111.1 uracil phosphoribosyltransferase [Peptoniphilus coxii]